MEEFINFSEYKDIYKYDDEYYTDINDYNVNLAFAVKLLPHSGHLFKPQESVKRAEAVLLFTNIYFVYGSGMKHTSEEEYNHHYADEAEIIASDNYPWGDVIDSSRFLWEWGYMRGDENDKIRPNDFITREEAYAVICRYYEREVLSRFKKYMH